MESDNSIDPSELMTWQQLLQRNSSPDASNVFLTPQSLQDIPNQSMAARILAAQGSNQGAKKQIQSELDALVAGKSTPALDEQQESVNTLKQRVEDYLNKPRDINLAPAAALADAWTGSQLARNYQAPETEQERAKNAAALESMVSQRQGDITKEKIDFLKHQIAAKVANLQSERQQSPTLALAQDRMDNQNHQKVLLAIKNNKDLGGLYRSTAGLSNAEAMAMNAKVMTPEQFHEFQQKIKNSLGIIGTTGLDERERTQFKDSGLDIAKYEQFLFNKPVDIKEDQRLFIEHLLDLASVVKKNNEVQSAAILKKLSSGNASMYKRRPDLFADLTDLKNAQMDQLKPESLTGPSNHAPPAPANQSPQAGMIKQGRGGVSYRFKGGNPSSKENWEMVK